MSDSDSAEQTVHTNSEVPLAVRYSPTEEEREVLKECRYESFFYRSVPISVSSMVLTQFLVSRGTLSASSRFGSLPKVLFAGVCGYFAGKLSYMRTCQEKFYRLENSPIGEALRQRGRYHQPLQSAGVQSEGHTESPNFSFADFTPDSHTQGPLVDAVELQKRPIGYEELRSRNRESYDKVHRDPTLKDVKKNKYGDAWED